MVKRPSPERRQRRERAVSGRSLNRVGTARFDPSATFSLLREEHIEYRKFIAAASSPIPRSAHPVPFGGEYAVAGLACRRRALRGCCVAGRRSRPLTKPRPGPSYACLRARKARSVGVHTLLELPSETALELSSETALELSSETA